jgi:4-hydroxy-4-methyl-2-oxoglutarate aldolase
MTGDQDLFDIFRNRLFSAVVGDVMDSIGLHHQFLPPSIRPLDPATVIVGRAMPVLVADIGEEDAPHDAPDFGVMFRALDELKAGEIYLTAGGSPTYSLWGGLMSVRAMKLGAAGAVLGGFHRDTREVLALGFPLFSEGAYAQDQRGRGLAVDFRVPVTFANGCRVAAGDLLLGDVDGVVAVPKDSVDEVVALALAKVDGEDVVRRMILDGETTEAAFARTGIM